MSAERKNTSSQDRNSKFKGRKRSGAPKTPRDNDRASETESVEGTFKDPGYAARKAATDLIGKVLSKRMPLDGELDLNNGHPGYKRLEPNDRALVRAIIGTALRRRGQIQDVIDRFLDRPIPEKTGRVLDILHVAMAQLFFMSVPDHAAVSLAVTLAGRDARAKPYKNLVNAVLRRATREGAAIIAEQDTAKLNAPDWMFVRWCEVYGEEAARAMSAAHMQEPYLDLSVPSDRDDWAEKLGGEVQLGYSVRLQPDGPIEKLEGFEDGKWWVQDAAAAVPARLLGDIKGKVVADLCAAPGGKTMQLAATGADVTAVDISARRLQRLTQNLKRVGLEAETEVSDLREFVPVDLFDAILLDAPCSATGTIRRHPDVAWLKREDDVLKLADLQYELLEKALGWLKPGGTLVYCTCSLEQEEGELQIQRLLLEHPEVQRVPVTAEELGGVAEAINSQGDFRAMPGQNPSSGKTSGGLDGFFAARLRLS
ncbi:16S rRNA (cytosine967-C5)-methyltransferase [Pseudovibrio ascidiaceicola]|uniref:16S rRNA (cytosine(967)-C(5))-methyltransferase n=1 Tax=Pseudovibrio ascidiaceicola TaxID=285279 RepID=A0A1I3VA27_9HYPH|nr:16S rRNA (cytosine(967)-C(5))-methyltransferase RsmB [Pseudovibrio ascidiaceicola]SFJ90981.1 16S rRNA (cytosine967-C5)-methyltransferase [Pseudovibrio ascidiaceicola]